MVELKSGHTFAAIDPYIAVVQNLKKTGHGSRRVYYLSAGINYGYEIVHSWDGAEYTQRPRHNNISNNNPNKKLCKCRWTVRCAMSVKILSSVQISCTTNRSTANEITGLKLTDL